MRRLTVVAAAILLFSGASLAADGPSDGEIHDQLMVKLAGDREVRGSHIEIEVKDGIVTLSGWVHNEKARKRAEKLTKKQKGVKEVVNKISLRTE